jgi:PAS domain S-box-containing protein
MVKSCLKLVLRTQLVRTPMRHAHWRMLKIYTWMSLPLPLLLGALLICFHQNILPWPVIAVAWAVLSIIAVGCGLCGAIHLASWASAGGKKDPATSPASSQCAIDDRAGSFLSSDLIDRQPLFDVFMDHLPALAFIKDSQGRYLYINSACKEMLNLTPEEIIGRSDCDLWPDETARVLCLNDAMLAGDNQVYSAIAPVMVGDDKRHHLLTKFSIHNEHQPPFLGGIAVDITEKVRAQEEKANLEQQLIQSQKMEAIGTLAGGIAHDFNNVLAAIMGYVELAMFDALPGSKVHEELDQVLKATNRATDLVRQILTFSRKTGQERQPIDPEQLVGEALKLIRATLPTTIEIRQHLQSDGAKVLANATQMHQVIVNLCTNAAHAMEENRGILEVRLDKKEFKGSAAGQHGVSPGPYLEISISDTGHGIPPVLKQRIFDPYFTTKAKGKGTGMGLAVARGIVQSHGGAIDVDSEPGKGTCFHILFPLTTTMIEVSSEKRESLPTGTESVLFVDDEPVLVDLGQQMLTHLGYKVTCYEDSQKALELFQEDPYRFDLVITDTTMPNMTGDIFASQLLALRPDLPVFLCTGYSEQLTQDKATRIGIAAFLMKPLSISDLALTLRSTLDKRLRACPRPYLRVAHSNS